MITDEKQGHLHPAGTDTANAVDLQGVHKSFGSVHAVRGMDLRVRPGEVVAFLGPNGAGKTTTIDMILGLSSPDEGEARVFGMTPRQAIAKGLVAAVLQTGGLLGDYTVLETVQLTGSLFAHSRPAQEVLERAGITDIAGRQVKKCSGGEKQRLRFAMALLSDPELIILDEPTTGMDVTGRRDFWAAIREDAGRGRTVMFATHYLEEADAYADRIVLVREGEIVADGSAAEVKAMTAGRLIRCRLPHPDEAALHGIPGADTVEIRGENVLISSRDSDQVARHLLTNTAAHDVEIAARGLEEAFIALTGADTGDH